MKEKEEGAKPQKSGFLVRLTALAATAALLGLECTVYMGADSTWTPCGGGLSTGSWRPARQVKLSHLPMQVGSRRPLPI